MQSVHQGLKDSASRLALPMSKEATAVGDPILRPADAGIYIGLSASTLAKRRMNAQPPTFVKLSPRLVGYRRSVLDAYLSERECTSTKQARDLNNGH